MKIFLWIFVALLLIFVTGYDHYYPTPNIMSEAEFADKMTDDIRHQDGRRGF